MWGVTTFSWTPSNPDHKTSYIAVIRGRRAVRWMNALRPELGRRRQAQIDRAVAGHHRKPHGNQKLTPAQIDAICRRKQAGESARDLAEEYGVHRTHVHRVVRQARRAGQDVS